MFLVLRHELWRFDGKSGAVFGSSGDDLVQQRPGCVQAFRRGDAEAIAFLRTLLLGLYLLEAEEQLRGSSRKLAKTFATAVDKEEARDYIGLIGFGVRTNSLGRGFEAWLSWFRDGWGLAVVFLLSRFEAVVAL